MRTIETGMFLFMLAMLVLAHNAIGCSGAKSPRAEMRSVVLTLAEAVKVADVTCASVARTKQDAPLARECDSHRDFAVEGLRAAEDALDASEEQKVPCAVVQAVSSLDRLIGIIEKAGGKVPNVAHDALDLARPFREACHG